MVVKVVVNKLQDINQMVINKINKTKKKMKKTILIYLLSLSTSVIFAQNGGMSNENAALKIEYEGMNNGMTVVKVTNKDTCTADMRVQWAQHIRNKDVAALSSDTFQLPTQPSCFIMATSSSPCRNVYYGQVELNYCQALPVTFEYLTARQISSNIIEVEFKLSQSDGEKQFNIQFSKDGINYKTVSVVTPESMVINKIYKIKVKI